MQSVPPWAQSQGMLRGIPDPSITINAALEIGSAADTVKMPMADEASPHTAPASDHKLTVPGQLHGAKPRHRNRRTRLKHTIWDLRRMTASIGTPLVETRNTQLVIQSDLIRIVRTLRQTKHVPILHIPRTHELRASSSPTAGQRRASIKI